MSFQVDSETVMVDFDDNEYICSEKSHTSSSDDDDDEEFEEVLSHELASDIHAQVDIDDNEISGLERSMDDEEICGMVQLLKVSSSTTTSAAKRMKKKSGAHGCAACMKMFETFRDIRRHVTKKHKVNSKALKCELDECRRLMTESPESEVNQYNYKLVVTKHAFLEKFSKR